MARAASSVLYSERMALAIQIIACAKRYRLKYFFTPDTTTTAQTYYVVHFNFQTVSVPMTLDAAIRTVKEAYADDRKRERQPTA